MLDGVLVRAEGVIVEKLVDRALADGVCFLSAERSGPREWRIWLDSANAERFLALAERFSFRAEVVERRGVGAMRRRLLARWSVLAGVLVALALPMLFSSRVWRIDIIAEESGGATARDLQNALSELGVAPGMAKSDVDAGALALRLYERAGGFSHIGVRLRGVRLQIEAVGESPAPQVFDLEADRDLVAARDAIVLSAEALAGTAKVKPGDAVVAGQLLIAGEERITKEETSGVCALGTVVARTWHTATVEAPLTGSERRLTGETSASATVRLFGFSHSLVAGREFALQQTEHDFLPIVGLFLPLGVEREARAEYEIVEKSLDISALQAEISQAALEKAISLVPDGCDIVDKWIDYSMIGEERIVARAVVEAQGNIAVPRAALTGPAP